MKTEMTTSNISTLGTLTLDDVRAGIEAIKNMRQEPVVTHFEACKKHVNFIREAVKEAKLPRPNSFGYMPLYAFPIIERPYLKTIHAHFNDGHIEKIPVTSRVK